MNEQIKEFNAIIEFRVAREKTFTVTVKAWLMQDRWQYNVYALISEKHELFNDVSKAINLPFNGGCTYEEIKTMTPAQGIKYGFEREVKTLVVGSDYAHIHDNYDHHSSPFDGIPHEVLRDAEELAEALKA